VSLPTIPLIAGVAKDVTLRQKTSSDLSQYDYVELRSEDYGLVLSSQNVTELEIQNLTDVLVHMPAFPGVNQQYAYWLVGYSGGLKTDLGGSGYITTREEP
jgi:hypothetical protein